MCYWHMRNWRLPDWHLRSGCSSDDGSRCGHDADRGLFDLQRTGCYQQRSDGRQLLRWFTDLLGSGNELWNSTRHDDFNAGHKQSDSG